MSYWKWHLWKEVWPNFFISVRNSSTFALPQPVFKKWLKLFLPFPLIVVQEIWNVPQNVWAHSNERHRLFNSRIKLKGVQFDQELLGKGRSEQESIRPWLSQMQTLSCSLSPSPSPSMSSPSLSLSLSLLMSLSSPLPVLTPTAISTSTSLYLNPYAYTNPYPYVAIYSY